MGFLKSLGLGVVNPMAVLGTVAAMGSSIYSAKQQADSVRETNASNEATAARQMSFSAEQAANQMRFQERISSTAHQREVEDLKAAGLNPLLSVNSGASSPSGASGSPAGYTAEPVPPVAGAAIASAMEVLRFKKEMKLLDAQTESAKEQAYSTRENTERTFEDRRGLRLENDFMDRRNKFFFDHPYLFKWHVMSNGINSASSVFRSLK